MMWYCCAEGSVDDRFGDAAPHQLLTRNLRRMPTPHHQTAHSSATMASMQLPLVITDQMATAVSSCEGVSHLKRACDAAIALVQP
jgi:hypothetical protein